MKPNKQIIIDAIISEIEKGTATSKILVAIGSKWKIPTTTYYRLYKLASKQHTEAQQALKKQLMAVSTKKAIEELKSNILTAQERKEYLCKMISGEIKAKRPFVIGGKIMEYPEEPTHSDRLKALAELNKMEGDYAPTKTELSGTITNNAPVIQILPPTE